jgi:hypothetical protein
MIEWIQDLVDKDRESFLHSVNAPALANSDVPVCSFPRVYG